MWCWLFHQKFWRMVWADGETCAIRCEKCKDQWYMPRMDAVINPRIKDGRGGDEAR